MESRPWPVEREGLRRRVQKRACQLWRPCLPALLDTLRFLFARNLLSTRSSGMSAVCMGICAWAFVLFVPAGSYHKNVKSKASNLESVLFRNEHGKRRGPILMVVNLCDARCFDGFYD